MYYEEDYDFDCREDYGSEDFERETWYALTDGQYGDYPGGSIDYDCLGF